MNIKINEILDTFLYLSSDKIHAYLSEAKNFSYLQDNILDYAFSNDFENLRKVVTSIPSDVILNIIDIKTIRNYFYKNPSKKDKMYRLFLVLIEYKNEIRSKLISCCEYKTLILECSDNLNKVWNLFSYEDIESLVSFAIKSNSPYISFVSDLPIDYQMALLNGDFTTSELIFLISKLKTTVQSEFFVHDKRATYLYKNFNLNLLVMFGVKFSREILLKSDFYEKLFVDDLVEFNYLITLLEQNTDYPVLVRKKANEFYDSIVSSYNASWNIFNQYIPLLNDKNYYYICEYENFYYYDLEQALYEKEDLERITSRKLSDVIVLLLFQDNYYNVILNIKEMLRFNRYVFFLSEEKIVFYKLILNIDSLSSEEKISIYHKFKDKKINTIFYSDIRKLKDASYEYINSSLVDFSCDDFTYLDGVKIYDYKDKEFYMLVRLENKHRDITKNPSNCYSLISNDGTSTIDSLVKNYDGFIYGYLNFDKEKVLHVLEADAYSGRYDHMLGNTSLYVNRITSSKELISSTNFYNELEVMNKAFGKSYESLRPDYIVCYDTPRKSDLEEAKRLNIPICLVRYKLLKREDNQSFDGRFNSYSFIDENIFVKNKR